MTSLRTFIAERRAQLLREIDVLRAELAELEKVEATLGVAPNSTQPAGSEPTTLKGMAIYVLRQQPASGLTANQILASIEQKFDLKVPRSSLSPQLSRLKREGILFQDGKNWRRVGAANKEAAYVQPLNENEPSGYQPDGSETRSDDGSNPSTAHVNPSGRDVFE